VSQVVVLLDVVLVLAVEDVELFLELVIVIFVGINLLLQIVVYVLQVLALGLYL